MIIKYDEKAGLEVAKILLEIGAINFNVTKPYRLASGVNSPVYVDCRKIISYPTGRDRVVDLMQEMFLKIFEQETVHNIAGGETAGIPLAAILADRLKLPLSYVRKKPKGYGINSQIEGDINQGQNILLVEDLATDGGSKLNFVNALRGNGVICNNIFVLFYYNIFSKAPVLLSENRLNLHYLTNWQDVLSVATNCGYFDIETLAYVENFLSNPASWSTNKNGN